MINKITNHNFNPPALTEHIPQEQKYPLNVAKFMKRQTANGRTPGSKSSFKVGTRTSFDTQVIRPSEPPVTKQDNKTPPDNHHQELQRSVRRERYVDGKSMARRDSPAYYKVCSNCWITGYFKAV